MAQVAEEAWIPCAWEFHVRSSELNELIAQPSNEQYAAKYSRPWPTHATIVYCFTVSDPTSTGLIQGHCLKNWEDGIKTCSHQKSAPQLFPVAVFSSDVRFTTWAILTGLINCLRAWHDSRSVRTILNAGRQLRSTLCHESYKTIYAANGCSAIASAILWRYTRCWSWI